MHSLVLIFVFATIAVLLTGVVFMMRGGKLNKKYGKHLMAARVGLQFIAVVILFLFFASSS